MSDIGKREAKGRDVDMANRMSTASLLVEMYKAGRGLFTPETIAQAGGVWHREVAGGQYVFPDGSMGRFAWYCRFVEYQPQATLAPEAASALPLIS